MDPVVALEIGTAKAVALVGEMREDGMIMITGRGEHPSSGVRKGEVIDLESATEVARKVLAEAEEGSKVDIEAVVLAVTGGHIRGVVYSGTVPVHDADGMITVDEIEDVMELARAVHLPEDREMMHTINQHYRVDGQGDVVNPEGMVGSKLELSVLGFHGARSQLRNTQRVVERIPMEVQDVVFGGIGAALAVLTPEQKRSGVTVIDLGAGTTNYIAYAGEVMACGGSIGVGGDHVTNDIMIAFSIPQTRAEKIKKEHGRAVVPDVVEPVKLALPAELGFVGNTVNVRALHTVINARMHETLMKIKKRMDEANVLPRTGSGVVLTGGGAHMKDITELAQSVFGVPCFVGKPRGILDLTRGGDGPEYAACCGLLDYVFRTQEQEGAERGSLLGSLVKSLFRRA